MTRHAVRHARHVDVDPTTPVASWPYEALVAVLERGLIHDWAVITSEIVRDPWGPVARQVEDYLAQESPRGLGPLLHRSIARSRRRAEQEERAAVVAHVQELFERSGLGATEFASRIGTSRSRLSTYRHGRVVPSAALVHRMEKVARGTAGRSEGIPEQQRTV